MRPGPAATLKLAVNADSLATWFPGVLARLEGGLQLDIAVDDEGHSSDWLRRGAVVAAVTAEAGPVQGCTSQALGALRYVAVCSPAFHARWFAGGVTAATLAAAPVVAFDRKDRIQHDWAERVAGAPVTLRPHFVPSAEAFVALALSGTAWSLHPEPLVRDHIGAGRLVPLGPAVPFDVDLHWQVSRHIGPAIADVTAAVRTAARDALRPPG